MIAAGLILSRFLHLSALMVLFGSGLFPFYAGASAPEDRRIVIIAARAALIGGVLWYFFTAAGMSGDLRGAVDWSVLALVGGSTAFGHLWLARLVVLVATLLLFAFGSERWAWFAGLILSGIAIVTIPWAGHGQNGEGSGSWIHAGGDVVHLLAAAIWIGALVRLLILLRCGKSGEQAKITKALIGFSAWGPATVALLLLSGLVNSWFLVGPQNLGGILRSPYGLTLVAKLLLFAAMMGLATANRFRLTPRLALAGNPATAAAATQALNQSIRAETLLAAAVLAAVALMGTLPAELTVWTTNPQPLHFSRPESYGVHDPVLRCETHAAIVSSPSRSGSARAWRHFGNRKITVRPRSRTADRHLPSVIEQRLAARSGDASDAGIEVAGQQTATLQRPLNWNVLDVSQLTPSQCVQAVTKLPHDTEIWSVHG